MATYIPSDDSSDIISEREYKHAKAMKTLKRKFTKYIDRWAAQKRDVRRLQAGKLLNSKLIAYCHRSYFSYLLQTNLHIDRNPSLYILREHKILFLKVVDQAQLLTAD
jgi:hypothetical protein